jgi:hypothetical protein
MYVNPTKSDFQNYFYRDFPFTANPSDLTKVQTKDITKAFCDADSMINPELFASQSSYTLGYLHLAAHFLVMNLRASSQGISGQFGWLETSKSVGSVSEGLQVPQRIMDNPMFAMLSKTNYGAKYLYMILPMLSGQIFIVSGETLP